MKYSFILFLLITLPVSGQDFSNAGLQSLVNAERSFSLMAKEKNTRDAFVHNLTAKSVGFYPGPTSALKFWEAQSAGQEWLFWQPSFAFLAASGDYGYTFGPWSFSKSRTDKPEAFGEFITVWEKINGEWKVAVDIGVNHAEQQVAGVSVKTSSIGAVSSKTKDDLSEVERKFLSAHSSSSETAYQENASADIRFFRRENFPIQSVAEGLRVHGPLTFHYEGNSISSSGDLGFVYGTVTISETINGEQKTRIANYLRIWKKEDGKQWKIVVDVVS